jgi:hypothetical protein
MCPHRTKCSKESRPALRVQTTLYYLGEGSYLFGFKISRKRPGSSVGIGTAYGLDGPEIESRWGRDFLHLSRPALRPAQPPVKLVSGLFRG